jgi:hypothetical protein
MNESEGIHDPDWERYKVTKDGTNAPVGDPTRWGAQVFTPLHDLFPTEFVTPQILQLATRDGYSRSWSLIGTLTMPTATWNGASSQCLLDLTLGVGQIQIAQSIVLYDAGNPSAVPPLAPGGLCRTQHSTLGGPYASILENNPASNANESRSFAIVGGLIGQSISIRARYQNSGFPPTAGFPTTARLCMIVTPYAAGEGL